MFNILELSITELLKNDSRHSYFDCLSSLSNKYSNLSKFKTSSKINIDSDILEVTEIIIKASIEAENLLKQGSFEKNSSFIMKIVIKTLKLAQKILAGLLLKSPLKIGIAYNAMHNVIKFLESKMKGK